MLLFVLCLLYGYHGYSNYGVDGIVLIPGASYSSKKFKTVSIPGVSSYMPKEKHLRTKRLLRMLGNSYDEEWMSIENPEPSNTVPESQAISDIIREKTAHAAIREEIARTLPELLDSNATVDKISTFLSRLTACNVVFEWEDQGVLFWPRYIKVGMCVSSAGSCSWPPGMGCVSDGPKTLHVLRWRCKRKSGKSKKTNCSDDLKRNNSKRGRINCKWKKVPFPVVSGCICSC